MTRRVSTPRRGEALSRESLVEASIQLLDANGEGGLTFSALSKRLGTGAGAIYWHIEDKDDLLGAACDAVVGSAINSCVAGKNPSTNIRNLALSLFDALDEHPWIGSALINSPGQLPALRILERIGQQIRLLGVPKRRQWTSVSALLHYILGVGGQNAANGQLARKRGLDRGEFLTKTSSIWSQLDPQEYPFTRSVAAQFETHDDREDFVSGIDCILRGVGGSRPKTSPGKRPSRD